jgi:adenylylsulfate kinase
VLVLAAVISPYEQARAAVRDAHEANGTPFALVHVATPLDVCRARDVKGLYARQSAGIISGLTGVDDPYDIPEEPELVIETHRQTPAESADALYALLTRMGVA